MDFTDLQMANLSDKSRRCVPSNCHALNNGSENRILKAGQDTHSSRLFSFKVPDCKHTELAHEVVVVAPGNIAESYTMICLMERVYFQRILLLEHRTIFNRKLSRSSIVQSERLLSP